MASMNTGDEQKNTAAGGPIPILLNATWHDLVRRLHKSRWSALLRAIESTAKAELYLAPPASVARAIAVLAPELLSAASLRVAIIGAEVIDAADFGRWYQMVPAMLGRDMNIEVDLVGPQLTPHPTALQRTIERERPANVRVESLHEYVNSAVRPDVFVFPNPGLTSGDYNWMQSDQIQAALTTGRPILGMSFDQLEGESDMAILQTKLKIDTRIVANPFYIDWENEGASCYWGKTLWRIAPNPNSVLRQAEAVYGQLEVIDQQLRADHARGLNTQYVGEEIPLEDPSGSKFVGVFGGQAVRLKDGRLFDICEIDGQHALRETDQMYPEMALVTFQNMAITTLERAALAATIRTMNDCMDQAGLANLPDDADLSTLLEALAKKEGIDTNSEEMDAIRQFFTEEFGVSGVDQEQPVFVAASKNDAAALMAAIKAGSDPNERDGEGWTALMEAARVDAAKCIAPLIEAGANIDDTVPRSGFTALHIAVTRSHIESARELIRLGADLDRPTVASTTTARMLINQVDSLAPLRAALT